MVMGSPPNTDAPVSVGICVPIARALPLDGNVARGVPFTCTAALSTVFPLALPALAPDPEDSEAPEDPEESSLPPEATSATTTAITTTAATAPSTIHVPRP